MDIEVNCHSSIRIAGERIIYIDPYNINRDVHDADIVFITHTHYDHLSEEDINKVSNKNTIIVSPENIGFDNNMVVKPEENYELLGIKFNTIRAYNVNKNFHPKANNWVGYIVYMNNLSYYIAGDTDITLENRKVICDVAFVPVGGTYTMDSIEAAKLINIIKPEIAIPVHYGSIVGTKDDALKFKEMLDNDIECKIFI